jgi:hypothetical protein
MELNVSTTRRDDYVMNNILEPNFLLTFAEHSGVLQW